ncbi:MULTISPECIES: triose-phosphate isomerase [Pseudovibrio]|uniref:Triosephosphate isomerase n=1 Tax=Pseudovibrio ascidiaceicola TaxID=285279 RepID=A0A1I4BZM8_9HYPH|nr:MULTISPECIES: triose-phosphate isomerase [Pseudovibrio]KZL06249.1 Triosephosphate isomerase [Pseudovibrio sp. Ad26]SFK74252.1 triosephosphate isomerase [Pseudovibrio ascidiaceicola]
MTNRPLVAGNWKMNGTKASAAELEAMGAGYDSALAENVELLICPPALLVAQLASQDKIAIGAQNCHAKESGAHTGDISAEMIRDAGGKFVIVGHSERREDHGESDADVCEKAEAAYRADLIAIVCVGEVESERRAGTTLDVVTKQVLGSVPAGATAENTVIAYEPVWAIGTGLTPTPADVAEVHASIRATLIKQFGGDVGGKMRVLYGGSVKPTNAKELLAVENVDGALVGGASLKATDFLGIAEAYRG